MSSTINAVVGMGPPRRASGAGIAHPAPTTASLPSSRMAARDRAQSWRGKYLRALNICPEDIELARRNAEKATTTANGKARVRAMSFHRSDYPDHLALSRSYSSSTEKEDEERKSLEKSTQLLHQRQQHLPQDQGHYAAHRTIPQQHHIRAVPLRAPSTTHHRLAVSSSQAMPIVSTPSNPYGFAIRPNMARDRRCHTDPFELQERVSAPIQIPSAAGGNNQLDGNERHDKYTSGGLRRRASPQSTQGEHDNLPTNNHTPNVRLLSWEEPVAMLAAADAVSKGWRMPHASAMSSMELGVRRGRRHEQQEEHMDEDEDQDDHDSHGGDIFAMDDSEDHDDSEDDMDDNQLTSQTIPPMTSSKSRRRYRTESMNIVSSGREKRTHHEYDDHDDMNSHHHGDHHGHHVVSQSFVPPHQMVDRSNCFSIGLRDELKKRRPANPI